MLLAVLAMVAVSLSVTSAVAAVDKPTLRSGFGPSLQVSWTAVRGAAGYKLQHSTSASFTSSVVTLPASGQPALTDTSTTINGLTVGKTYYVRLAEVDSRGRVGSYGTAASAVPRYPLPPPGDLYRTKVTNNGMTVSWDAVPDAPGYTVRAHSPGNPTKYFVTTKPSVSLTGLKADTTYALSATVTKPGTGSTNAVTLSESSPEVRTTTSTYALAAPDGLKATSQASDAVGLTWTAVDGVPSDGGYRVSYALNAAQTDAQKTTATFTGTTGKLTGLAANTTHFATVHVVDRDGKRLSKSSDFIVAKSIVPRGTIAGEVSGVTGSDLTAAAYDRNGNVAQAVTVGSDNKYRLDVRPGKDYRVQLMYTGTGDHASAWARSGSDGGWTMSSASPIEVRRDSTTTAPAVRIKKGHVVSGKVVGQNGKTVPNVDIAAISAVGTEREVIALGRSAADDPAKKDSKNGTFAVDGLATGTYWLRFVYSGDGFRVLSKSMRVDSDKGITVTLANADFRSRYKAYINGTRRVGSTLSVHATPWLAGSYPTTRARMTYQWKRNGAAISGATGSTYRLGSADRGKTITITATASRYGYNTGSTTSRGVRIS